MPGFLKQFQKRDCTKIFCRLHFNVLTQLNYYHNRIGYNALHELLDFGGQEDIPSDAIKSKYSYARAAFAKPSDRETRSV
jgi:hypothetical protein